MKKNQILLLVSILLFTTSTMPGPKGGGESRTKPASGPKPTGIMGKIKSYFSGDKATPGAAKEVGTLKLGTTSQTTPTTTTRPLPPLPSKHQASQPPVQSHAIKPLPPIPQIGNQPTTKPSVKPRSTIPTKIEIAPLITPPTSKELLQIILDAEKVRTLKDQLSFTKDPKIFDALSPTVDLLYKETVDEISKTPSNDPKLHSLTTMKDRLTILKNTIKS